MFSTKDAQGERNFIKPGVNSIKILGFSVSDDERALIMRARRLDGTDDDYRDFRFYITPAAIPHTMRKIKHILHVVSSNDEIEASTAKDFAKQLNSKLKGAEMDYLFNGREYEREKDGKVFVNVSAEVGLFPPFASPVGAGTLKFDEARHIERLPKMDEDAKGDNGNDGDDLPF